MPSENPITKKELQAVMKKIIAGVGKRNLCKWEAIEYSFTVSEIFNMMEMRGYIKSKPVREMFLEESTREYERHYSREALDEADRRIEKELNQVPVHN